jgi:seryl-tRNA synthetase
MDIEVPVVRIGIRECWGDLIKNVYWVDDKIQWVSRATERDDVLRIRYDADTIPRATLDAIHKLSGDIAQSYERVPVQELFRLGDCIRRTEGDEAMSALVRRGTLRFRERGCVEASGIFLALLRALDRHFVRYASKLGATEFSFPSMLPASVAERCGIFENYPQQVCYVHRSAGHTTTAESAVPVSDDVLRRNMLDKADKPAYDTILSPAVCYHFWCHPTELLPENAGKIYLGTAVGRCYRSEVQALVDLDRLQEFNMREIFAVGDEEQLSTLRQRFLDFVQQLMIEFKIEGRIQTAADPFFVNVFAKKRVFQVNLKLKYEALAWLPGKGELLAVASVNDHRDHFTRAFGLTLERGDQLHSSCLAFGLERLALSLIVQHGLEPRKWPAALLEVFEK